MSHYSITRCPAAVQKCRRPSQESLAGAGVEQETDELPGLRLTANQPVVARFVSVPPGHARTASAGTAGRGRDGDIGAVTGDADGITTAGFIKATSATFVRAAVRGPVVTNAVPGAHQRRIGAQALAVGPAGIPGPALPWCAALRQAAALGRMQGATFHQGAHQASP